MGEVLFEFLQQLHSQPEKLTLQEVNFFQRCKANATKNLTVGTVVGSGLAWIASRRLGSRFLRINLMAGAGAIAGIWRLGNSLDSCVDQIIALEGSRMQTELANVIVQRFPNDPRRMQLISKLFYSERVFDDSTLDQPKLRWRYRNFCVDNTAYSQRTPDSDSDSKHSDAESEQVPMNSGISLMADPFDCIFGHSARGEESRHRDRPRVLNRSHKRSHRRRRLRHQNVSQTLNT